MSASTAEDAASAGTRPVAVPVDSCKGFDANAEPGAAAAYASGEADDDRVDVLIPVYNAAPWLARSIASIQAQTHRCLRIHVVDDGSTDASAAILAGLAAEDERIVVHTRVNGGIVEALNVGLGFCTARWLARHDGDDVAEPRRFERQLAYLRSHPLCVAVGGVARHIDGEGRVTGTLTELRPPRDVDAGWLPAREPYLMHPLLFARREAVVAAGGYRHSVHSEDSDLYWRLAELGSLHNLADVLGDYRMHAASISSASIVNGRMMAVGSQLSALSARRRRAGVADVVLASAMAGRMREMVSLAAMVVHVGLMLDVGERAHFERAVAAKLLELTDYLPYELDRDDVSFIARVLRGRGLRDVVPANRRSIDKLLARAAMRLAAENRLRDAALLMPAAMLPWAAARLAWRSGRAVSRWVLPRR